MAGMDAFSDCDGFPISWALNMQNPYDFTNFGYIRDPSHTYVEDVHVEGESPSAPYGDIYMGIVSKKCVKDVDAVKSKCDDIDYVISVKDGGTGEYPFGCINQHSENGYGKCSYVPDDVKHHYIETRDWEKVMDQYGGAIFCCSMPSTYTFDKDDPWMSDLQDKSGCLNGNDPVRTMKCPPSHWPGSPLCVPVLQSYCSDSSNWLNDDFTDKNGKKYSYCDLYMSEGNGASLQNQQTILLSGLEDWVVNDLQNGKVKPDPSKDDRVKLFTDYCANNTGVCDTFLETACLNVTKDDLKDNPDLAKMCGCFMQDMEYMLPGIIPVECNGMCAVNSAIGGVVKGYFDENTNSYQPLQCKQSTCVIDDVTVNLIDSELDGNISFNQICGGCPSGACTCVFNDITIDGTNAVIKGNINFEQNCGLCSQTGITSDGQPVTCSGEPLTGGTNPSLSTNKHNYKSIDHIRSRNNDTLSVSRWIYVFIVVLLIVVFLVLMFI